MNATVVAAPSTSPARRDRTFHTGLAIAFLITAIVGFGPTYFWQGLRPSPPLTPLLQVHAIVFTSWLLLLVTQSALISARRPDLHKRLGVAGAVLGAAMVPLGIMTAIEAARRGVTADGLEPLVFMVFPVGAVVMFVAFVGAALAWRRQPQIHRRLIVLGTVSIMTPAIARLPYLGRNPVVALAASLLFVLAAMIHDWRTRGRVHHIYVWGAAVIFLSGPIRAAIGNSAAWRALAQYLVG